ncbi:hypothetical protein PtrM4_082280 [Pyrenophora tritici-repentis]|uniref:Integrase catalytic domain-containing protein n=1 Tax=Pyrenophora tritici-repentis TaxID=45151 RepID=A0A834VRX4_9PLEO|nr:hypothetical protein PtrM4_082280 [Pyrenophora tritici-repentis]
MATNQSQRDATVILTDSSKWIPWYRQIKMQCEALEIWDIVDPAGNTQPRTKPTEPLPPLVSDYEPAAALRNTSSAPSSSTRTARANARAPTQDTVDIVNPAVQTPAIPARYSELSAEGKEAYDGDSREFKMVFESYKIRERNYRDERTNIAAMIRHLNATVSPHLQVSCFEEHGTLRTWITNLQVAVGVDLDDEIRRVRERYHDSLRPMRSPQNWESWLSEYDQAATRAEALKIGDVIQSKLVVDDFLKAVSKIAPAWMATFTGAGSDRNNIERRQMMKLFREHMSLAHPTRGKSRSAFMTGEAAYAASGESDSNTQGDASSVQIRAPSTNPSQGNQRQTNKRKMNAPGNKSKQFQKRNTAEAGDICPACEQRHDINGREISRLDEGMMKAAFNASNQGYPLKDAFILDSGSTTHICNNLSRLEDVRPPAMGDYIWAGNSRVWIQGYGAVKVTAEGAQGKQILHLSNVAWCPDFLCSLVSFRLLRRQGIWWDNRGDPTSLRRWDGSTIATLSEHYGQWVIEPPTTSTSAFHVRMNRAKRSPQKATAILWHKRLGHPGPSAIEHLVQQSEGVRIKGITTVECDACGRSKSKRQIRRTPRLNDEGPGERVAIDFHERSRYTWDFYFKDNRPARSIIRLLGLFVQFMKKQFNITVKVIETDNEIVTVKQEVEKWCTSLSIKLEPSAPDTQAQNGGAERSGGVIKEKARAIRLDANLPWELWPETTRAAVYLYNRTPNYPNNWKTPYEIFYTHAAAMNGIVTGPRKPNQAHLKAYGCKAFAMTDDTHRGKSRLQRLDPKAWIGYLVGYQSTNIYRIWIPSMAKVISTRDVVFDEETIFNGKTEDLMDNLMHNPLEEIATWVRTVELPGTQSQQAETETFYEDDTTQEESPRTQKTRYHQGRKVVEAYLTPPPTPPPVALLVQGEVNNEDMTNMSNQSTSMTSPWAAAFMAGTESGHIGQHEGKSIDKAQVKRLLSKGIKPHRNQLPPLPTAYSKLEDHPLYDMFKEAEKTHLRSHQQMKSWTEVQASPVKRAGHQILDCMWVYTYKLDKHHRLIKCKARLVVRGDQQRNITSQDTYAATLAGRSFRMLMAIAAKYDLELKQYDVTNAFVHAAIDREIYMRMPKGYQKPGTLLKVQKALYGLRISPLLWQKEFTATLASIGFQQIPQEPCCMIKDGVIIFFYVDDIIVAYRSKQESEAMKAINWIQEKYACTGGDNLQWFLGVEVMRNRKQKTIQLSQAAYVDKISQLINHQNVRHDTPMSGIELRPREGLAAPAEVNKYQRKIGSLLFAAVTTRPDIAFATSRLARFLINPSTEHQDAADRVLLYLKKTESLALELGRGDGLEVASDASFADNTLDRKSSQGYAIKLFGGLIAWRASKQDTVTTSTTEAELLALSQVAKEAILTSRLLKELQVKLSNPIITIKCDNTQTIRLVNEDVAKLQTKLRHVDIHNHWLRQEVTRKVIKVEYVPSDNMIADGFTKPLPANKWARFLDQLGLVEREEAPLREIELKEVQEQLEGLIM